MTNFVGFDQVLSRVPLGRQIPAGFDVINRAQPPLYVQWTDLDPYELKPSAHDEVLPFLHLPDGALIALWYYSAEPAVVLIGGHGGWEVVSRDFGNFLKALNTNCTGIYDFDEEEHDLRFEFASGEPDLSGLAELRERFKGWREKHTALLKPLEGHEAEAVRKRVHEIAKRMIDDGLSKVYKSSSAWWSIDFKIDIEGGALWVDYRDHGAWCAVPDKYALVNEIEVLLELANNPTRTYYELSVSKPGIVSLDRDRTLVLVPPKV